MLFVYIIHITGSRLNQDTESKAVYFMLLKVVPSSDRISWGSDSWTSEEALGALLAFEHVIAKVLSDKVDDGYFSMDDAKELSEKLLFRNASGIYGIDPNITYISR